MKNKKKMNNIKLKTINMLKVILFPILMIFILGPLEVYYGNISEFDFLVTDFIYGFVGLSVVIILLGLLIATLIPKKILNILICIITSFSIVSYLQNLFFNSVLASNNGTKIEWSSLSKLKISNTILWGALLLIITIILFVIYKKRDINIVCNISLCLAIIQFIAIISCLAGIISYKKEIQHYQLSGENQFYVSAGDNIIVIILDAAPAELFNEVYQNNPNIAEGLKDFTYYNNYDSLYCPTFPSVLHMLTGYEPNTKYTRMEYAKLAWDSDEANDFYNLLHDKGYTCNLYSNRQTYTYGMIENLEGKIDNIEHIESATNYKLMYPMMLKYSLYKYAPYCIKDRFEVVESHYQGVVYYTLQDEVVEPNSKIYQILQNKKIKINSEWDNAFIVEHIEGCHNERSSEKLHESIDICNEYINQLKDLGLYDNSTIIILADHGDYQNTNMWQPIFFIKRKGVKQNCMSVDTSPICSNDFIPTVSLIMGENFSKYGTTIYDWSEGQKRERTTYYMDKTSKGGLFGYTYYTDGNEIMKKKDYDVKYYSSEW